MVIQIAASVIDKILKIFKSHSKWYR